MAFPGTGKIWMNGTLVDWKDATIHVASHVIHYGSAVFEGARCYATPKGSACFRLDAHMRRLQHSAKIYRMEYPLDLAGWDERRARHDPRERDEVVLHPADRLSRLRLARRQPVPCPVDAADHAVGLGRVPRPGGARERRRRQSAAPGRGWRRTRCRRWPRAPPTTRTRPDQDGSDHRRLRRRHRARRLRATSAKAAARTSSSCATARSITPPLGSSILGGITRDSIMTLARDLGFTVNETTLPREALYIADEVFFVGTAAEVTPIRSVDKIQIGAGRRGPITEAAAARVLRRHQRRGARHARLAHLRLSGRSASVRTPQRAGTRGQGLEARSSSRGCTLERIRASESAIRMHVNDLLKIAVDAGASDLHLKVGSYPMMRVRGMLMPAAEEQEARSRRRRRDERGGDVHRAAAEVQGRAGSRPRLQRPGPRPLPLQHLPAARHRRPRAPRHPDADPHDRRARAAAGAQEDRRRGARPGAGHRHDRQRQEHDARRDDRPHQPDALART